MLLEGNTLEKGTEWYSITVNGDLNSRTAASYFKDYVTQTILEPGIKYVVLTQGPDSSINSDGLENIISLYKTLKSIGGLLQAYGLKEQTAHIIHIAKLEPILGNHETLEEAIAAIEQAKSI